MLMKERHIPYLTPLEIVEYEVSPSDVLGAIVVSMERELERITQLDTIIPEWKRSQTSHLREKIRSYKVAMRTLSSSSDTKECICPRDFGR